MHIDDREQVSSADSFENSKPRAPIKSQRYVQDLIIEPQNKFFLNTEFLKNFLKAVPQMESYVYTFCCHFLFSPNKPKKTRKD